MKIRFTPSARAQYLAALAYIRQDNPGAALRFRQHADVLLKRLETFPDSGRLIPEYPELPHREVVIPPYRFFYRVKDDVVWIMAVWHGAQLPDEPENI